jgi:transcriptional regulator with XRE-family HTH domain
MNAGATVEMNAEFGTKLRWAIRARFGPNQEREFARTIGMDPTQLSRTLNGKVGKRPEIETLQRYADGLGLPLRTLIDWTLPEGARADGDGKDGTGPEGGDIFDRAPLSRLDAELKRLPTAPGQPTFAEQMRQLDRLPDDRRARVIRRLARDFLWRLREELEREEEDGPE